MRIAGDAGVPFVYKSSYDKANRSSARSYRGPGPPGGPADPRAACGRRSAAPCSRTSTRPAEVPAAAEVLDLLQIPAFLCRQTDLVLACARSGRPVNVKKGQFLAPWDMRNVVEKLRGDGCEDVLLTERGATFGYNNLVVDFRGLRVMQGLGVPVVFDATHSVQLPGRGGRPAPAASASTSSRWRGRPWPSASTRCSWRSTRTRSAPRRTGPRCSRSPGSPRLLRELARDRGRPRRPP